MIWAKLSLRISARSGVIPVSSASVGVTVTSVHQTRHAVNTNTGQAIGGTTGAQMVYSLLDDLQYEFEGSPHHLDLNYGNCADNGIPLAADPRGTVGLLADNLFITDIKINFQTIFNIFQKKIIKTIKRLKQIIII